MNQTNDIYPKQGLKEIQEYKEAQERVQKYVRELLTERSQWVDKRMKELVPKWQRWLMLKTKSKFLINLFNWEVKMFNYPEVNKHIIEIHYKGKVIDSKTFKA